MSTTIRTGRLQDWQRQHVERMYEMYGFTPCQRLVCDRLLMGLANGEVAEALGITCQSVKNHIGRINARLGTADRLQIVLVLLGQIAAPNHDKLMAVLEAKVDAEEAKITAARERIRFLRGEAA